MEFLGIPLQGAELEFPLKEDDFSALQMIEEVRDLKREYICIHPGASVESRRWSPQKFAVVADFLAARGLQVILTGTTAEAELTQAVQKAMRFSAINLAGRTSLGAIAALLSKACLLVCNDTGVSHLAAALQVKSVVIFSASDPNRWAPLNRERHRVLVNEVTPSAVIAQVEDLSKELTCVA
jgi:ADP-heptose:LPS heptosyltransferase